MVKTKKMLMIPGPVPVSDSVLQSLGREVQAHTDPEFTAAFQSLLAELRALVKCDGIAFVIAGSGTLGMEMAAANVVSDRDKVLICSNGFFGDRYVSICEKRGYNADIIRARWGSSVTAEEVDRELARGGHSVLIMTHVETSTGAMIPLEAIAKMVREKYPQVLFIVDGVAACGGAMVDMTWGVDLYFTCSQKALGCVPGMAVLWANERALAKRAAMAPIRESYIDFDRWVPVMLDTNKYWGTPAVNNIWALKEAVRLVTEEGHEARCRRHADDAALISDAMAAISFKTACGADFRAPTLSVFLYPDDMPVSDADFRAAVAKEGGVVAGCLGDFAGKGFRVGHMANLDKHMLISGVAAVERACLRCGLNVRPGAALAVMQKSLAARD